MKRFSIFTLLGLSIQILSGQTESFTERFYESYESYKEPTLHMRRIKHKDLEPLIDRYSTSKGFEVQNVGSSIEGRALRLISLGTGTTDVFLWSQMHGDEPTATQAIFDILNFFASSDFIKEKEDLLKKVRIHFLPMLNPDGAEVFKRRNYLGIDINRDALTLQSPESKVLKKIRDSLQADFGFNLHDQSRYYNAERTPKPATISYLAPAYNYEKEINEVRGRAMQVIGYMNRIVQQYAPGQVGRYNDDFEPRAFGDNIQKWGTSAILIESGGYPDDLEKQEIRKLNYVSILSAIYAIGSESYKTVPLEDYYAIPNNNRMLFDLKIENVIYPLNGKNYQIDLGIFKLESDLPEHREFWNVGQIGDMGDLSTYFGYETLNADGLLLKTGEIFPETVANLEAVSKLNLPALLQTGITYVKVHQLPENQKFSPFPIMIVPEDFEKPESKWEVGDNPTFVLWRDNTPAYALINGFLVDLIELNTSDKVNNGLILR